MSPRVTPNLYTYCNTVPELIQFTTLQLSPRFATPGTVGSMANTKSTKRINSVNVRMDDATLEKLRVIATQEKRTVSNLIDWIVGRWLEDQEKAETAKK